MTSRSYHLLSLYITLSSCPHFCDDGCGIVVPVFLQQRMCVEWRIGPYHWKILSSRVVKRFSAHDYDRSLEWRIITFNMWYRWKSLLVHISSSLKIMNRSFCMLYSTRFCYILFRKTSSERTGRSVMVVVGGWFCMNKIKLISKRAAMSISIYQLHGSSICWR